MASVAARGRGRRYSSTQPDRLASVVPGDLAHRRRLLLHTWIPARHRFACGGRSFTNRNSGPGRGDAALRAAYLFASGGAILRTAGFDRTTGAFVAGMV